MIIRFTERRWSVRWESGEGKVKYTTKMGAVPNLIMLMKNHWD